MPLHLGQLLILRREGGEHMRDKLVAITGAASGIGRALANEAIDRGYFVALFDSDSVGLACLSGTLGAESCLWFAGDTRKANDLAAFVHAVKSTGKPVEYAFANAGMLRLGEIGAQPFDEIEQMVSVNVLGAVRFAQAILPVMDGQDSASRLVFTGSISMFGAVPKFGIYSATKQSVWAIAEALSAELRVRGSRVEVSLICPAAVKTAIADEASGTGDDLEKLKRRMQDRGISPETLAVHVFEELSLGHELIYSDERFKPAARARLDSVFEGRFRA